MNCDQFMALLPRYPDDLPDDATREAMLAHAATCAACAQALADQQAMLDTLRTMDDGTEVPPPAAASWRAAIRAEDKPARKPFFARWQGWVATAAAVLVVVGGTSLMRNGLLFPQAMQATEALTGTAYTATQETGAAMSKARLMDSVDVEDEMFAPMATAMDDAESMPSAGGGQQAAATVVLQSASLGISSDQFDADLARLQTLLDEVGGWMAYQSISGEAFATNPDGGRYATLQMRVPDAALDTFLAGLGTIGKTTSNSRTAEDITTRYQDTQGRLAMYTAQRDRLVDLLAEAQDMADILLIEEHLGEVTYELEALQSRINGWDSRAAYASVDVWVEETQPTRNDPQSTLGQRLRLALSNSWQAARAFAADMLVFLVMAAPYILCVVLASVVIWVVYRGRRRNK